MISNVVHRLRLRLKAEHYEPSEPVHKISLKFLVIDDFSNSYFWLQKIKLKPFIATLVYIIYISYNVSLG
jgi:hypothetical protein